ncbi:MAG: hypothetical protein GZ086_12940 [Gelidibacter sp.]|nr:hypothetical protein [Gelidibacter sp.]
MFENLGCFQISISPYGSEIKESIEISAVKSKRILFRPDKRLKLFLKGIKFTKSGFKQ